jgi:hypothetical protein
VRRALAFVLLASALKLLDVSNKQTAIILSLALVVAPVLWMVIRRRHGFPALASRAEARTRGAVPGGGAAGRSEGTRPTSP